ncbi:EAL domain-containing response regulator [Pseudomonas peli]|uniref:EAL domain-containing response regulator n=1 Tax=Pseudomonas peli TaxID=592361 RepID=UPI0024AD714D|nr:EAL domain-containing response regulator [Pseudomonas peli]
MENFSILILEDHPLTLRMLALNLQGIGYTNVVTCQSGEHALKLLESQGHFDILICDIQMPGIDGLAFLRSALDVGRIDGLILSSEVPSDLRLATQQLARLIGYQVLGDLHKPVDQKKLASLLKRFTPSNEKALKKHNQKNNSGPTAEELLQGILNDEFIPYYKPKVDLKTNELIGLEVSIRWHHPKLGLLLPASFLKVAEELGYIKDISKSIMTQAFSFFKKNRLFYKAHLVIKLSTCQLASPNLIFELKEMLNNEQLPAHSLVIEFTETGVLEAPIAISENFMRLRLLGCGLCIGNFGSGFSSLQRICEMPCTELKLDPSFVQSITFNSRSLAAVDSLLRFAGNLGLSVIADHIDRLSQLRLLQSLRCPAGQGYLFAPPMQGNEFNKWLLQHEAT